MAHRVSGRTPKGFFSERSRSNLLHLARRRGGLLFGGALGGGAFGGGLRVGGGTLGLGRRQLADLARQSVRVGGRAAEYAQAAAAENLIRLACSC